MAENFNVDVVGIDLSINMVSFALERAIGLNCSVEFEVADCTKKTYPENSFDVIYSRDTILHIQVRRLFFLIYLFIFIFLEGGSCYLNSFKHCLFIYLYYYLFYFLFLMDNVEQLYTHSLKFECLLVNFQDKPALFRSFYKWLKPGGKVLISDYCKNTGTPSLEFAEYIKQRGYDLHDVKSYGQVCCI